MVPSAYITRGLHNQGLSAGQEQKGTSTQQSEQLSCMHCRFSGCHALVVRRFRDDDERAPLLAVVEQTFPYLISIFQGLLAVPNPPIEVAELLKLLCKVFWSANYVSAASRS